MPIKEMYVEWDLDPKHFTVGRTTHHNGTEIETNIVTLGVITVG